MKLKASYTPKMIHYAWRVKPFMLRRKSDRRIAAIGVWFRFGWRYSSLWVEF